MKRTREIVFTSIGLAISSLLAIAIVVFLLLSDTIGNSDAFIKYSEAGDISSNMNDVDYFLKVLTNISWEFLAVLIIASLLGIAALYCYAGNKRSGIANILVVIAAIILVIGTLLIGIIPALSYLIAGIIGKVRKRPFYDPFEDAETNK